MNKVFFFLLGVFGFFTACSQEPIFADIEREIKLREQTVKNNVYSVVAFENDFYAANLALFTKSKSSQGGWHKTSAPGKVIRLAVGENGGTSYLYLLTTTYQIYYKTAGTGWQLVSGLADKNTLELYGDGKSAWTTVSKAGKRVPYLLEGATAASSASDTEAKNPLAASSAKGTTVFSDSLSFAYNHEDKIVYTLGDIEKFVSGSRAASYYNDGSRKWLIVGVNGGIRMISLESDGKIPESPSVTNNDLANASTSIGPYDVFPGAVWAFDNHALFVAIHDRDDSDINGLWGYYPSRNTWNRE
ncbi:MAG: hypothetical protein ACRC4W_06350 [Treponemataceae bacterium]